MELMDTVLCSVVLSQCCDWSCRKCVWRSVWACWVGGLPWVWYGLAWYGMVWYGDMVLHGLVLLLLYDTAFCCSYFSLDLCSNLFCDNVRVTLSVHMSRTGCVILDTVGIFLSFLSFFFLSSFFFTPLCGVFGPIELKMKWIECMHHAVHTLWHWHKRLCSLCSILMVLYLSSPHSPSFLVIQIHIFQPVEKSFFLALLCSVLPCSALHCYPRLR